MAGKLLRCSGSCLTRLLSAVETTWNERSGRSGKVPLAEAWLMICAVARQLFRELRDVRRPGAAARTRQVSHGAS